MSDSISLDDMIGIADQQNRMVDILLKAFINVGGNPQDVGYFVNRLDIPASSQRRMLVAFVKNVLNKELWEIASQRVSIGAIDYRSTPEEFVKQYHLQVRIEIPPGTKHADQSISGDFTYSLEHEDRYESLWSIAKKYSNRGVSVADWRELLAYAAFLQSKKVDLKGYEIFAFGSSFRNGKGASSYPRLCMKHGPDWQQISLVWESLKEYPPISRRRFYLVRHSSASST